MGLKYGNGRIEGRRNGDKEGGGRVDEEVRKEQHRQNAGDLQQL